ncbi:hypothetical protein IKW72_01585 [bacterium]|nr:hypothetical protein [bacterium]
MKKTIALLCLAVAALSLRAQDPLLPVRLELDSSFAPANSTAYLKFTIHTGNPASVLWSNSLLTPDYEPLYGVACQLSGSTAYLLLGNTALPNMAALPKDLFSEGSVRKIRVWIASSANGSFRQLTPDLDLVAAPYSLYSEESKDVDPAVIAEHTGSLASLNNSLRTANAKIAGLQAVSTGLTNGTVTIPSAASFFSRLVTGASGETIYKISSAVKGPPAPALTPEHFSITYATHFSSSIRVKETAYPESVTLYFKNASEIAPPQAVCIFLPKAEITLLASAVSVSTAAFPRCVYSFSQNVSRLVPGEYYVGLRTTSGNAAIHPYVCQSYRQGGSRYYYEEPEIEPVISATVPTVGPYWKFSDAKELWFEISFREDTGLALSSAGLTVKGGLSVGSDAVLTERNISGNVSSLLGESVFIGEEALSPDLRSKLITTAGGSITGALTVADLRLPNNGNWYIGTASARCDLVLVNTNACLRSETGDLLLGASGNIRPLAFVDFSPSQGGRADIPKGKTEIVLFSSGISDNSVICVTPAQRIDTLYWVETDPLGRAKLCLGTALDHTVSFHYVLLRK